MVARTARVMLVVGLALVFAEFGYGWTGYTDEPAKGPVGPPPGFDLSPPGDRASDGGTVSYEEEPSPDAPPSSANIPDQPQDEPKSEPKESPRGTTGATEPPAKGDKGDPGDKGDRGDTGPQGPQGIQGPPGLNADLCSNLPDTQTKPPPKRWPQRYWGFKPRLEPRVLTINKQSQLVCVTVSWAKKHSLFVLKR